MTIIDQKLYRHNGNDPLWTNQYTDQEPKQQFYFTMSNDF